MSADPVTLSMGKERHWSTDDLQYACVKKLEVFSLDQEKLVSEQEQWCDRRERETKYGSDSPK